MTIIFFYFFFIHFSLFFEWSTLGNDVCHRWLSKLKHHFSCEDCFGFWPFGPKVFIPILSTKRESWLKSISEKWTILSTCPKASIKVISKYRDLGILFGLKGLASLKLQQVLMHTKLPIISSYKNSSFRLPDFWRIREMIFGSEILRPIVWVGVIKKFIRFFKIVPLEVPHFYSSDFTVKRSVY